MASLPVQTTSFVGREEQIRLVRQLLASTRLLTLTGAGGCGKTRLALRAAEELVDTYSDRVWFVELASIADPALVLKTVAAAAGVRDIPGRALLETLLSHLRERTSLMILDNCEHVVEAAAQVSDAILRGCSDVRILATSREPLRCPGETTWRVPSLDLPPFGPTAVSDLKALATCESVRLFVDRAEAALPGFELTDANAASVQDICRRLDGIPLAIELAAARVHAFSVEQIADRLDDRFRLLTRGPRTAVPRQQTLRAAVDWSHGLLSAPERAVLRRLSLFAGGWTLEAAEEVAAGADVQAHAVLDLLPALVDKSLVVADHQPGAVRYRLLDTIRQYARERLSEANEVERTRDRHLAYFLHLAEGVEPKLRGPEARAVMEHLSVEHDNLRLAIEWALQTANSDAALRLAGALGWFWWGRDYHSEGRRWLTLALASSSQATAPRMKALHASGWLAHHQRDTSEARTVLEESLAIAGRLDDKRAIALALHTLGRVAYYENDPETARSLAEESLAVAEAVGDDWLIAWAIHLLGLAAYLENDFPRARAHYERALAIRRGLGYEEGIGILLGLLGLVAVREGDLTEARERFGGALVIMHGLLEPWQLAMILAAFTWIAASEEQLLRAVRLGAAVSRLREMYDTPLIPVLEPLLVEGLELAMQQLRSPDYVQAWSDGRALSVEEAVAEALAVEVRSPAVRTPRGHRGEGALGTLSATELRVLRLLASGQTTKEIAAELVVGVSTIDRHITHIYQKLGVRNRAEATAMALERGLDRGKPLTSTDTTR